MNIAMSSSWSERNSAPFILECIPFPNIKFLIPLISFSRSIKRWYVCEWHRPSRQNSIKPVTSLHAVSADKSSFQLNRSPALSANQQRSRRFMRISMITLQNSRFGSPVTAFKKTPELRSFSTRVHSRSRRTRSLNSTSAPYFEPFDQREAAAARAISRRLRADSASALALPPFNPPRCPKATAAGFLAPFPLVLWATMEAAI